MPPAIPPFRHFRQSQFYVLTKANIRKHQPPAASFLRWGAVEICSNVEEIHEFTSLNWLMSQRWCKTLEPLETKGVGPSASCPKLLPFQDEYFGRYLSKQRHELGNMPSRNLAVATMILPLGSKGGSASFIATAGKASGRIESNEIIQVW